MVYSSTVIEVRKTAVFSDWLSRLDDSRARARIAERIRRVGLGNLGDVKPVGEGVSELRIDYGPGYRVYLVRRGTEVVILLCGGAKSSQAKDIARARALAKQDMTWR
jgi:putative addiction module killer protein